MQPPLVLDLTRLLPGPLAGRILRDLGYRVHRVVPPGGDLLAGHSPATFAWLNSGKSEETVDLKTQEGRHRLLDLVGQASVLLDSNRPGVMERLGVGPEVLLDANPGLSYVRIAGHAADDFRQVPGHDLTYLAAAGLLDRFDRAWPGVQLADSAGALWAVIAAQRGLLRGGGVFDVELERAPRVFAYPPVAGLDGTRVCYAVYPARGGRVALAAVEPHLWARTCEAFGHMEWIDEAHSPVAETNSVWQALQQILRQRTPAEWEDFGRARALPLRAVRPPRAPGDPDDWTLIPWN
ncbi:MAG: CoA transferase [Thermaerobacter sp.]|nr:CoA transferase [Thermaerobacter sp.]